MKHHSRAQLTQYSNLNRWICGGMTRIRSISRMWLVHNQLLEYAHFWGGCFLSPVAMATPAAEGESGRREGGEGEPHYTYRHFIPWGWDDCYIWLGLGPMRGLGSSIGSIVPIHSFQSHSSPACWSGLHRLSTQLPVVVRDKYESVDRVRKFPVEYYRNTTCEHASNCELKNI